MENGGLSYIIARFLASKETLASDRFALQETKFTLSVLKKFIASAIQAQSYIKTGKEPQDFTTKKMVEIMQKGTQNVLESIDFANLQQRLLGILKSIVLKDSRIVTEEKNIVSNALALLECCIMYREDLFQHFLKTE